MGRELTRAKRVYNRDRAASRRMAPRRGDVARERRRAGRGAQVEGQGRNKAPDVGDNRKERKIYWVRGDAGVDSTLGPNK